MFSLEKKNFKDWIDFFSTLWVILSTGSLVFCIFNMELSMFMLLGIAFLYILTTHGTLVKKRHLCVMIGVLCFIVLNGVLNIGYLELNKDVIILLMRLFSVTIICANITREKFMKYFCEILFFLCCLSLVCFLFSELGFALPGQKELWIKDKFYIYTFYHTVGRWEPFHRNAGIFWESPAFAIFINLAILFMMLGDVKMEGKKKGIYLLVYSVTIFTTLSTLAYLEFVLCIAAAACRFWNGGERGKKAKTMKYLMIIFMVLLLVCLAILESKLGIIEHKLINRQGSFGERANDTIETLLMAFRRPWTGFGLFNNYTREALYEVKVMNNSNGFVTMILYLGLPLSVIYYGYFGYRLKKLFECNFMSYLCVIGAFLIILNSEQICTMTLMLFFLFPLKDELEKKGQSQREISRGGC